MEEMHYRGYTGSIEYSKEDHCYFGQVLHIRSLISYEGQNKYELFLDFRNAVNSYLSICREYKIKPEEQDEHEEKEEV